MQATTTDLSMTLAVEQSPEQVFAAIKDFRRWWSGRFEGSADHVGDEFTYRYNDLHTSRQRVTELIPGVRIVWHVIDSRLTFLNHQSEWTGTDIVFDIARKGDLTEIRFTHLGVNPDAECYRACSDGWGRLVNGNLRRLIATGQNQPDAFA